MSIFDPYTMEQIAEKITTQITAFDTRLDKLSGVLSFGLADDSYKALYDAAGAISLTMGGVCLAIAVVMAYGAIVKEGLTLSGDWKKIVTILLRLAITKGLIDTSTQFIMWIYSFPAAITKLVITYTTKHTASAAESGMTVTSICDSLGVTTKSNALDTFIAFQYAQFIGLGFYLLSIAIFIIALARIIKIYTLLSFSSLAFAKIPLYGFDGCKDYIKEMCALGLQGGIIATSVCIYRVSNSILPDICGSGSIGSSLVLVISMLLLIFKSEELARKVI